MKKGAGMNGSMDKPSSVTKTSTKMMTHVKAPSKASGLDMTKAHPLHTGRKTTNTYSAYKAN